MSEQDRLRTVVCSQCGTALQEEPGAPVADRQPCPSCGSKNRLVSLWLQGQIELHSMLRLKGLEAGRKRPFLKAKVGDDLFRKTGEWNRVEQVVDRRNNRYKKRVVNPRTGKLQRDVDEPLTAHKGYGSAKGPEEAEGAE